MTEAKMKYLEYRKELYASPGYSPIVDRGRNKLALAPERVRELMAEKAAALAARNEEADPQGVRINSMTVWEEDRKRKVNPPSDRRLSSYTREQQRVLECRLASLRRGGVRDPEASGVLDVAMSDLDELAGMAGQI